VRGRGRKWRSRAARALHLVGDAAPPDANDAHQSTDDRHPQDDGQKQLPEDLYALLPEV